eukprot:6483082-Amphidinium_carterae.1
MNNPRQGTSVQLHSFNINGWKTNCTNLLGALDTAQPHLIALQETLLDSTSGRSADGLCHKLGFKTIWGHMADPVPNAAHTLRCNRTQCPGVGLIFSSRLDVTPLQLHTKEARALFEQGRIVAAKLATPASPVLLYNVYLPSGKQAHEERQRCYQVIFDELACQPHMPMVVLGDLNEDIDRNALAYQLSLQGWRRPLLMDAEGDIVEYTYSCGNIQSRIDALYLSPLAFSSVHRVVARTLQGTRGNMNHSLLSVEVQLTDTDHIVRPPQPIHFTRGPRFHCHSPIHWAEEKHKIQEILDKARNDFESDRFTSWSLDIDRCWSHFETCLYRHLVACHSLDFDKHGENYSPPAVEEFVTTAPKMKVTRPCTRTKRTGPMRLRAHLYRLIELSKSPSSAHALKRILADEEFICSSLRIDKDTFQAHMRNPTNAVPVWHEALSRYMTRHKDQGVQRWRQSLLDKNGQVTRKCFHWLKREVLPNHFALLEGETTLTGAREFFARSTSYWSSLMNRSSEERQQSFCNVHGRTNRLQEPLEQDIAVLKKCLRKVKVHAAGGLDRWAGSAMRLLPDEALPILLSFYQTFEQTTHFPPPLTWARMHLIPKFSTGVGRVEDYRPISVLSFFYRVWSAYRLHMIGVEFYEYFPSEMRGGLPGRDYGDMLTSIMLDVESAISVAVDPANDVVHPVFWFSLDAQKCFDNIGYMSAFDACHKAGIPPALTKTLGSIWLASKRYVSSGGQICPVPFTTSNGIFQGCCLSVVACLCLVVLWSKAVRAAGADNVTTPSYVDDRYIRTPCMDTMMHAAEASRVWERDNHFVLNKKKSALVQAPTTNNALIYESTPIPEPDCVTTLGTEIPLKYHASGALLRKRAQTAIRTGLRIHALHLPLPISQGLVESAMLPQLSHNVTATLYSKVELQRVRSVVRRACRTEARAHSFEVCAAILARPHRYDPESQVMYMHITSLVKSLRFRGTGLDTWRRMSEQRLYIVPRGPRGVYLRYLAKLSLVELDAQTLQHCTHGQIHLLDSSWSDFTHWLRSCIRYRLLNNAQNRRHRLQGAQDCDVAVTAAFYRSKNCGLRAELASILADALWCLHKKHVCDLAPSEICCFCHQNVPETVEHALWECDAWRQQRDMIPPCILTHIHTFTPAARLCGFCPSTAPQQCKAVW